MPKIGMEAIRKKALVEATIHEVGTRGTLEVTVSQIARRAGVSSGLAHHYFGNKEQILIAAMRHILKRFGELVRSELKKAELPAQRVEFDDAAVLMFISRHSFQCRIKWPDTMARTKQTTHKVPRTHADKNAEKILQRTRDHLKKQ